MTKKLLTIVTAVSLVFTLGITTMAKVLDDINTTIKSPQPMRAYIEHENQSNVDNFGQTIGLDWKINSKWITSASYQLEGDGNNEATLAVGAGYVINPNLNAVLTYETADSLDATGLAINGTYALQKPWVMVGGAKYKDYSNDVELFGLYAGAQYQFNQNITAGVNYVLDDYSNADADNYFVVKATYTLKEYSAYCKYETPDAGNKITIGASYNF